MTCLCCGSAHQLCLHLCRTVSQSFCGTSAGVLVLLAVGTALLILIVGQNIMDIAQKVGHDDKGADLAQTMTSVLPRLLERM